MVEREANSEIQGKSEGGNRDHRKQGVLTLSFQGSHPHQEEKRETSTGTSVTDGKEEKNLEKGKGHIDSFLRSVSYAR